MEGRSSIQKNVCINEINGAVKPFPPTLGDERECDLGLNKIYIVYVNAHSLSGQLTEQLI